MSLEHVVAGLVLLTLLSWFWRGRGVRELALQHAQRRCRVEGLQLLDAHVAFAGWRWLRGTENRGWLARSYSFEFSVTGVDRHTGRLAMHGRRLLQIELPPYPIPQQEPQVIDPGRLRQCPADD